MVRIHRLSTAALVAVCCALLPLASGCRRHVPAVGDQVVSRERVRAQSRVIDDPSHLFADDGTLLESNQRLLGLALPRGLTERYVAGRQHTYESNVVAEKLQQYFGPRLVTGNVERIGEGVVYRNATVRGSSASTRVDVAILPLANHRYSIAITELYVPPAHMPNEQLIEDALRRQSAEAR